MKIDGLLQCDDSYMTVFCAKGIYFELKLHIRHR